MNKFISKRENHTSDIKENTLWATLSFLVPCIVTAVVMMVCRITPFGNGTLINGANSAWFENFSGMYRSVIAGDGVFYHLNVGFGSSFYPEFATGLCSPFLFLAFFFGQRSLAVAYTFITIVRAGSAGAAAWYMLRKCSDAESPMCFALSCGYSLCGFTAFAAYYPSVADGAVFLPLLIAGIYSYVQSSRPVRLFVFGAVFFLTCSRLSLLGIILSAALYAAFYTRKGSRRQRIYKTALFASTLLCSAAVNAILVIPIWKASVYYKSGVFSEMKANDIVSDLCFGGYGTTPSGGVGLCLAGLLMIGFFAFFFNTRIVAGEKISVASGAAAIILCHTVPVLSRIVLGFGNVGGEWVNAGFMLALLAVYCTARGYCEREGLETWGLASSIAVYLLAAVLSAVLGRGEVFALLAEMGLAVFACAVSVQLTVSRERPSFRLSALTAAALILFGGVHCAGAAGRMESVITADRVRFIADSKINAEKALEQSYREKNEEVPRFYRTRSTDGVSDSVNINRNQVDGLTAFAERLGIMRASQYGGADNFTPFTDMLFGIALPDYGYYSQEEILRSACSPAFLIGDWNDVLPEEMNAFELQNYLADKWFGAELFETAEPVGTDCELSAGSDRYKWTFGNERTAVFKYIFEPVEDGDLYLLVDNYTYSFAVGSDSRSNWQPGCAGGIFNLTQLNKSDDGKVTVYIAVDVSKCDIKPVFMVCHGSIETAAAARGAQYISHRGSTIRFMLRCSGSQTALTSIPFESGWEITVNGEKGDPVELCGGLTGIRLEKGNNSIVMNYTPPYFRTSLWISVIMLVFGLYLTLKIEHQAARRRKVRMAFRAVELNISRMNSDSTHQPSVHSDEEAQAVHSDEEVEAVLPSEEAQAVHSDEEVEDSVPETDDETADLSIDETEKGSEENA